MGDWSFDNPPECLPEEMDPFYEEDVSAENDREDAFVMKDGCIQQFHYG